MTAVTFRTCERNSGQYEQHTNGCHSGLPEYIPLVELCLKKQGHGTFLDICTVAFSS